jgi:F0F1-type ATP synthase membrane subunit b/b'
MKRKSRVLLISCALSAIFMAMSFGAASLRAEEDSNKNPRTQTAQEVFKWINFALVAGAGIWLFGKVLPPRFRGNAEKIESAIAKATQAKNAADAQLQEAEKKLASLEKEVGELREQATQDAAAETERLHAATKSDEEKIAAAGNAEIAAAERAARLELKALAAKLAVDGAETLLAQQLTPQVQESLVNAFVKSLESRPN